MGQRSAVDGQAFGTVMSDDVVKVVAADDSAASWLGVDGARLEARSKYAEGPNGRED